MGTCNRIPLAITASLLIALTLSSCSPATFVWGYVSERDDLRLAFCSSSIATAARLSVSARDEFEDFVEVESAVWSGPRIALPEGAIVDAGDLPEGWQATNNLGLDMPWERIDIQLYDGDTFVGSASLRNQDAMREQWSLSPRPGLFVGTTSCASPFEVDFAEQAPYVPDTTVAELAQTEWIAMPEDQFWGYFEGTRSPAAIAERLSTLSIDDIVGFEAQLRLQLYSLDHAAIWNQSESQRRSSEDHSTSSFSWFEQLRGLIIMGGQESVNAALGDDVVPEMRSSHPDATVLSVAERAAELSGQTWLPSNLDLEPGMGENPDGW